MVRVADRDDFGNLTGFDVDLGGELGNGWLTAETLGEGSPRFLQCEIIFLHRPWNPNIPPPITEVLADPPSSSGWQTTEVSTLVQVESIYGVDKADTGNLNEVIVALTAPSVPGVDVLGNGQTRLDNYHS